MKNFKVKSRVKNDQLVLCINNKLHCQIKNANSIIGIVCYYEGTEDHCIELNFNNTKEKVLLIYDTDEK